PCSPAYVPPRCLSHRFSAAAPHSGGHPVSAFPEEDDGVGPGTPTITRDQNSSVNPPNRYPVSTTSLWLDMITPARLIPAPPRFPPRHRHPQRHFRPPGGNGP